MKLSNMLRRYNDVVADFRCGLHSGFRLCDILWYCLVWNPFSLYESSYSKWYHQKLGQQGGGVKCPLCVLLKPKQVEVKPCDCTYKHTTQYWKLTNIRNWFNKDRWQKTLNESKYHKHNLYETNLWNLLKKSPPLN